jgi:hypothetical protein
LAFGIINGQNAAKSSRSPLAAFLQSIWVHGIPQRKVATHCKIVERPFQGRNGLVQISSPNGLNPASNGSFVE